MGYRPTGITNGKTLLNLFCIAFAKTLNVLKKKSFFNRNYNNKLRKNKHMNTLILTFVNHVMNYTVKQVISIFIIKSKEKHTIYKSIIYVSKIVIIISIGHDCVGPFFPGKRV